MNYEKYTPFMACEKSADLVRAFQNKMTDVRDEQKALGDELGAEEVVQQWGVVGFTFKGSAAPEGWKNKGSVKGKPYFAPQRRSKKDKALWVRLNAARTPRASDFAANFPGTKGGVMTTDLGPNGHGMVIRYLTFEIVGDNIVLLSPLDSKGKCVKPLDSTELKMSEFFALKEAKTDSPPPSVVA